MSGERRQGESAYPHCLELHRVCVSPMHEGWIHVTTNTHATVSIINVQAGPSAILK